MKIKFVGIIEQEQRDVLKIILGQAFHGETPTTVRSSDLVRCAFTESEAGHILSLIAGNERNGEHTAPRERYWKRSERIKSKLLNGNVRRTPNSTCQP